VAIVVFHLFCTVHFAAVCHLVPVRPLGAAAGALTCSQLPSSTATLLQSEDREQERKGRKKKNKKRKKS